jgi:sporulation protein YqfC
VIKTGEVLFMKKEKERKNWRENLVTSLEVPGDLAMKETIITLTGRNHAVVCNYKSILRYQQEEIVVLGFHGKVVIRGKRLMIPKYTSEEMQIEGMISEIVME